jgi:hypothetical protein
LPTRSTKDLPEGFRVDLDDKGWRHWWRTPAGGALLMIGSLRFACWPPSYLGMDRFELFFAIVAVTGFVTLTGAIIWMWLYWATTLPWLIGMRWFAQGSTRLKHRGDLRSKYVFKRLAVDAPSVCWAPNQRPLFGSPLAFRSWRLRLKKSSLGELRAEHFELIDHINSTARTQNKPANDMAFSHWWVCRLLYPRNH